MTSLEADPAGTQTARGIAERVEPGVDRLRFVALGLLAALAGLMVFDTFAALFRP